MSRNVLLTVSGRVPPDVRDTIASGRRPRADYLEMAAAFDGDIVDHGDAESAAGPLGRLVWRLAGADAALALVCFRRRKQLGSGW